MTTATAPAPIAIQNGTYTIRNRHTGDYRTFRLRTQKEEARFAPGERILSLLTGSDNENSYTGIGFVRDRELRTWSRVAGTQFTTLGQMFMLVVLNEVAPAKLGGSWQDHYEVMHAGTCVRCNRKLTRPESIESGIGPECASRM